ncbi:hypothetical protein C7H19_25085 [Aphanothece hegewaldii CCALA 016]|uniref:CARDB domain-containing protein n=1 Tax=Aphanothece hegewaldii CCALA 016 TaxID=2107694 RepID=A0A2T1LQC4_9CHRO|nr:CARDB domain-containing protein [Aphanothece hegewaldii]PSF26712.1 hypothetical protein C7H19_25085 [Aphanothece hegewaldii CCALA 016]
MIDIAVNNVEFALNPITGQKSEISFELQNLTDCRAKNFQTQIYQSKDLMIDESDRLIRSNGNNLDAYSNKSIKKFIHINPNEGNYLLIQTDAFDQFDESDEENNFAVCPCGMDLSISPLNYTLNQNYLTVSYRIYNEGLTSNSTTAQVWLDGAKISTVPIIPIEDGQNHGVLHIFKLSSPLFGQHEVRVVVDPDNLIHESNENNNVWLFPING